MTTGKLIVLIVIAVFAAVFIIFPEARKLIRGFISIFIQDTAKTAEGARAVYDQKIDEVQRAYSRSAAVYKKLTGETAETERALEEARKSIKSAEASAESAVRGGRMEDAAIFADEREDAISTVEELTKKLQELKKMEARAKTAYQENEKLLNKLKAEAKKVVRQINTDAELKRLYEELDESCRVGSTDKLLDSVRDGANDLRKEAAGAATIHGQKLSTRKAEAEERARKDSTSEYLNSLKVRYGAKDK